MPAPPNKAPLHDDPSQIIVMKESSLAPLKRHCLNTVAPHQRSTAGRKWLLLGGRGDPANQACRANTNELGGLLKTTEYTTYSVLVLQRRHTVSRLCTVWSTVCTVLLRKLEGARDLKALEISSGGGACLLHLLVAASSTMLPKSDLPPSPTAPRNPSILHSNRNTVPSDTDPVL